MLSAKNFATKCLCFEMLCLLLLGVALGACASSDADNSRDALYGIRTVSFDKNGGDTEAVPASITLYPPATTLDSLPAEPTRAGHRFAGWNTEKDGSGSPFTASSPVTSPILTIVYAQWELPLGLHLPRETLCFSPMTSSEYGERFTVTVSGFKNAADASKATLEAHAAAGNEPLWFSWQVEQGPYAEGSQTFVFSFAYHGTHFSEGPATLSIQLKDIPPGYAYSGESRTLHITTADGQQARTILVHQDNIERFNAYASTDSGLRLHYQLIENVTLPKAAEGTSNWTAIGNSGSNNQHLFTGSLDGGGHSIFGLAIHEPSADEQGMFGCIGPNAELKNLRLEGVNVRGHEAVGGVLGRNAGGVVHSCHVSGKVQGFSRVGGVVGWNAPGLVRDSHSTSSVEGERDLGGVVGRTYDRVQDCSSSGKVKGDNNVGGVVGMSFWDSTVQGSHSTGSVEGLDNVGGVVGQNGKVVENCYATGKVSGQYSVGGVVGLNLDIGHVNKSHATGDVSGKNAVGGVVGQNDNVVENSYATGNVSGSSDVGGLVGWSIGDVKNSYATGNVSGDYTAGGLVGNNGGLLQNSYATGNVIGLEYVGGLVGFNGSMLRNCVALNPRVLLKTDIALGRVAGQNDGNLLNNYARSDMDIRFYVNSDGSGGTEKPFGGSGGEDGIHALATEYGGMSFWLQKLVTGPSNNIVWNFDLVWEWKAGGLPILRGVGGVQNPTVP